MDAEEIAHAREIIKIYKRQLRALQQQAAKHGSHCPPYIEMEIESTQQKIDLWTQHIDVGPVPTLPSMHESTQDTSMPQHSNTPAFNMSMRPEHTSCPYPGMLPFTAENHRYYYGRESDIQHMLLLLRYHRCIYVIGPSGCGKSSLISAGLLPRLEKSKSYPTGFWLVRTMRPGNQPMQALLQVVEGELSQLGRDLEHVLEVHHPAQRLLLVIDQFEEFFIQADRDEQARFIDALRTLQSLERCQIIIVLRADFYGDLMASDLWPIPSTQRLEIVPLRGEELRKAITQPATDVGISLEQELISRLLADAADEPGVLPLIQEMMILLWDQIEDNWVRLSFYERLGRNGQSGLAAAIATKADATYAALSTIQQPIARRIFLRLIQFSDERAPTRRQQPASALRETNDNPQLFEETLQYLTKNRLLTLSGAEGDPTRKIDIAHEALITSWPTLQHWLDQYQGHERYRRRLKQKLDEWIHLGRERGGLLDNVELSMATSWLSSPAAQAVGLDAELHEYYDASMQKVLEDAKLYQLTLASAVLEERSRIARDLHDAVSQTLFSASLIAEGLRETNNLSQARQRQGLEELRQLTRGALAEMRALLYELHPGGLAEKPLGHLLAALCTAFTSRTRIPVALTVTGPDQLQPEIQEMLYRIAQEALNNVGKHAAANAARIELICSPEEVVLVIADDGRGFDVTSQSQASLGIGIMSERAAKIGAKLRIESQVGTGTTITIVWRVNTQAAPVDSA